MKKILLLSILCAGTTFAQTTVVLDANNVSANISDNGCFFNDFTNSLAGYEWPATSGKKSIFTGSLWFAGQDVNGQVKLAAQRYCGNGQDFWPGGLSKYEAEHQPTAFNQTIWTVTQAEINDHIVNHMNPGYVAPPGIANWPAHGDVTLGSDGMLPYIAPFVDFNGDGEYHSTDGDYPCIKGTKAAYVIMNDKGGVHTSSGGDPIGIELHYMFYQFGFEPGLEDVTFVDLEIVNMGTQTLQDFTSSFFIDFDLGDYSDDYLGTDSTRNMMFCYNADNNDATMGGSLGYGTPPPAVGVMCLSHPLDYTSVFTSGGSPNTTDPSTVTGYYNVMRGKWANGGDRLDPNGNPFNFFFPGDPNDTQGWSEFQSGAVPGDRRMLMSIDLGTLTPDMPNQGVNGRRTMSFAVLHAEGTDHLNSVTELYTLADSVQSFYDELNINGCFDPATANIQEVSSNSFSIQPNPSTGTFNVVLPEVLSAFEIHVTDLYGRDIIKKQVTNSDSASIELNEQAGIYLVHLKYNDKLTTRRVVLK